MRMLRFFLGLILSLSLAVIVLISSVEISAYSDFSFYEKEYKKYAVTEFAGISMPDLMNVTRDMMSYLKGERESLADIKVTVKGTDHTAFFNEREIAHMRDVRSLFTGAVILRRILLAVSIACIILSILLGGRLHYFGSVLVYGTLGLLATAVALSLMVAGDFNRYFIVFHHIFFNNDLWMLDPASDNLINMLPEGFFMDMAGRIITVYVICSAILAGTGMVLRAFAKNK